MKKRNDKRIGNEFWKLAPKVGRNAIFERPEDLQTACLEYFEQTSKRIIEKQDFSGKLEITRKYNPPFTLRGLCVFLGITENTWRNYKEKKEFLRVCEQVENVIYTHKFEGASLGIFSPSIIARDLGLSEKSNKEISISRPVLEGGRELPPDIQDIDLLK